MKRRSLLMASVGVLLPVTGCVSRVIQPGVDNLVLIRNLTDEDIDVELRITSDEDVVIEDDFSLEPRASYDSGAIEQPGEYEYVVETEEQTHSETITLPLGDYGRITETRLSETKIRIEENGVDIHRFVQD